MRVLVLGKRGMVAHIMIMYLRERGHDVDSISLRNEVDFRPKDGYDVVINCIGILVADSEKNKAEAVYFNSYLPHMLEEWYRYTDTKVIHISTDCVSDGDFYGRTKALGEIENDKDLTLRMSLIGADMKPSGTGLFNWFMRQEGEIDGYVCAIWNGITTLQLAKSIEQAMDLVGIYNLVPAKGMSKYDLLQTLNYEFDKNLIIKPVELGRDKTLPPGDKIPIPTYRTMLKEMKEWIYEHPETYSHYMCKENIKSESQR